MSNKDDIQLFPVARIGVGPVPRLGFIIIRPDFLPSPMQATLEPTTGPSYALTPVQARALIADIQSALDAVENSELQRPDSPPH